MRLKILLPDRLCLDLEVVRIVAEGPDGAFGMLPHHIDYVSQLAPGILTYEETGGQVRYAGIHSGTLVKVGDEVLVSTSGAVLGDDVEDVLDGEGNHPQVPPLPHSASVRRRTHWQ